MEAHAHIDLGIIDGVGSILLVAPAGLPSVERTQVDGDAGGRHPVRVAAEIGLHDAAIRSAVEAVAQFVDAGAGHGRQTEGELVATHGLHLVGIQAGPGIVVGIVIDKVGVVVDPQVIEVLIDAVRGDIYVLVAVGGGFLLADIVGHGFGEERHAVEADAAPLHVVAHGVGIGQRGIDGIDVAVGDVGEHGVGVVGEHPATHTVGRAGDFLVRSPAAVVEDGKAVQAYASRGAALIDLYQTAWPHRGVEIPEGDAQQVAVYAVAIFVVVDDELVRRYLHGQQMIGGPLMEQMAGVRIVGAGREAICGGILAMALNPLREEMKQLGAGRVDTLTAPEVVLLGKEREAILPMLWNGSDITLVEAHAGHAGQVLNLIRLIETLVGLVPHGVEGIEQSAFAQYSGNSQIGPLLPLDNLLQISGSRDVLGSND